MTALPWLQEYYPITKAAKVNKKALIKVILNGRELYECFAKKCNLLLTQIGKYRVEILMNNRGFAYSNPIVVMR